MPKFPSQEWADAVRGAVNANSEYAEAATAWEGDILLSVRPDPKAPAGGGVRLDLFHGECRSATFVPDPSSVACEFTFEAARADWARMVKRELDPVKAILDGTIRIRGNLAKLMRYTKASKALVESVASVPAEM